MATVYCYDVEGCDAVLYATSDEALAIGMGDGVSVRVDDLGKEELGALVRGLDKLVVQTRGAFEVFAEEYARRMLVGT